MSDAGTLHVHPGPLSGFAVSLAEHADAVGRLWSRDHRLWRDDPTEIADRLGWLDAPTAQLGEAASHVQLGRQAREDGLTDAVVLGMGGSSLFPDVLRRTFEATGLRLTVLDSTHPDAVARVLDLPLETTLFSVASKSGTTLETRSHLEAAWASRQSLQAPGSHFVAVTDPGSELESLARDRGFRAVLLAPPDVGGRFSAMTPFGLGPAGLLGVDVEGLVRSAVEELDRCRAAAAENPGARLGVLLASAARAGRTKVTLRFGDEAAPLADWVEQLVAESLGKDGVSVVPIVGEQDADPEELLAEDRVHVVIGDAAAAKVLVDAGAPVAVAGWGGPLDLGAQVVRWEVATAVAGAVLGVQPFDQPDVASAKAATNAVLEAGLSDVATTGVADALARVGTGDLLAITAFVDPDGPIAADLPRVQAALRRELGVAVTIGLGPRYLHSTGQLHKGGDDRIVVLQVVDTPNGDVDIPGRDFGFATLLAAQAEGDLAALRERGRRAFRVDAKELLGQR